MIQDGAGAASTFSSQSMIKDGAGASTFSSQNECEDRKEGV